MYVYIHIYTWYCSAHSLNDTHHSAWYSEAAAYDGAMSCNHVCVNIFIYKYTYIYIIYI